MMSKRCGPGRAAGIMTKAEAQKKKALLCKGNFGKRGQARVLFPAKE